MNQQERWHRQRALADGGSVLTKASLPVAGMSPQYAGSGPAERLCESTTFQRYHAVHGETACSLALVWGLCMHRYLGTMVTWPGGPCQRCLLAKPRVSTSPMGGRQPTCCLCQSTCLPHPLPRPGQGWLPLATAPVAPDLVPLFSSLQAKQVVSVPPDLWRLGLRGEGIPPRWDAELVMPLPFPQWPSLERWPRLRPLPGVACTSSVTLLRVSQVCHDELFEHTKGCATHYNLLLLIAMVP